ncbi:hypothetical protein DPMN_160628 [Dreissena polymorpha]|uniref:Uncharacterized protein n=1 Tax=Dreissena polymorpha TaxID=45954 RepID=A0A9D4EL51_DREPO|nr:hypothetical protein DPMN_160628 [Dreissena polymorpha]
MAFQKQPCDGDWQIEKMFTVDVIQCLLEYRKKFCPSIVFSWFTLDMFFQDACGIMAVCEYRERMDFAQLTNDELYKRYCINHATLAHIIAQLDAALAPNTDRSYSLSTGYKVRMVYHYINTQIVFDHNDMIMDIVARWPESTHD